MAYLGCVGPPNPGDKHCCHKHSPGDQRFQEEPQRCTPPCTPPQPPNPAGRGNPSRARPPPTLHPEPGKALFVGDHHCHPHQHSGRRATSASSPRVNTGTTGLPPQPACFPTPSTAMGLAVGSDPPTECSPRVPEAHVAIDAHLRCASHSVSAHTAATATHPLALVGAGDTGTTASTQSLVAEPRTGAAARFLPHPPPPPRLPPPHPPLTASRSSVSKNGARAKPGAGNTRGRGAAPPNCTINTSTQ